MREDSSASLSRLAVSCNVVGTHCIGGGNVCCCACCVTEVQKGCPLASKMNACKPTGSRERLDNAGLTGNIDWSAPLVLVTEVVGGGQSMPPVWAADDDRVVAMQAREESCSGSVFPSPLVLLGSGQNAQSGSRFLGRRDSRRVSNVSRALGPVDVARDDVPAVVPADDWR